MGVDVRTDVRTYVPCTVHCATVCGSERVKFLYIANAAVQTTAGPFGTGCVGFGWVGRPVAGSVRRLIEFVAGECSVVYVSKY